MDPAFSGMMCFPLKMQDLFFFLFLEKNHFKKMVLSRHLFLFYFKREKKKKEKPQM